MTWFEELMGFSEHSPEYVRENINFDGSTLSSKVNKKSYGYGHLELLSLGDLRSRVKSKESQISGSISVEEVLADVQDLHQDKSNSGCLFQVASQFNLLEMAGPDITPEQGIGIYENDNTQGPKCAIAAGAGTIYRNYYVEVNGQIGQSENNQIDCLKDLGCALGNTDKQLWFMKNGYVKTSSPSLKLITEKLCSATEQEIDEWRKLLQIGLQWDTQVTINNSQHAVSQAYCSALPISYSYEALEAWEAFARLILDAAYEATICAAILNSMNTGNNRVFLTLVGGGAFGNKIDWIISSAKRAIGLYENWDIRVVFVSHKHSNEYIHSLVKEI